MGKWIIKTRSREVVEFAKKRGATVKGNGEFVIYPPSNSEAHRIYYRYSWECELYEAEVENDMDKTRRL